MKIIKKTSKEWDQINFNYIESCIMDNESIFQSYEVTTESLTDRVKFVLDCFNSEYNYINNKKRYPNLSNRIGDWFMGLPSVINIDFENYKIIEIGKQMGVLSQDATEKQEDKFLESWFTYNAHYLLKLAKKLKIETNYLN